MLVTLCVKVVEKLLGYITWTAKVKDETEGGEGGESDAHITTRQMNVLGGALDPTPTMRSFLLQLLLRYRQDAAAVTCYCYQLLTNTVL